ncbi:M3 family metallopeptidase [Planococcus halocryophilus]|uniref:M3 family metallopeptidase n=1 Tax=Planococcus halocryophilus TaxID=1215089 RepID=UPI001F0E7433|nr:M3 family metallopeptidase [Planococcus halocryophilus]MCH4827509.1 peptidase M3 [Planococcus halocryophilus]
METSSLVTRWNLDSLPYDSDVEKFKDQLGIIKGKLIEIEKESNLAGLNESNLLTLSQLIRQIESAESFYYCLTTEEIESSQLTSIIGTISALKSQVYAIVSNWEEQLNDMNETQLTKWTNHVKQSNFLAELANNQEKDSQQEKMIPNFSRETLSGLADLYSQVRNNLKVEVGYDHEKKEVSFAEAMEQAFALPEQAERFHVFTELNKTLETQSNIFASIYNQMVGIRLHENKIKQTDYLDESLKFNGITNQTLDAMWNAVDANMQGLSSYFNKKEEAGAGKISWHELMTSSQNDSFSITFSQAAAEIINSLAPIDGNMSEFVKVALTKGWVDVEPRKTKSSGGFCAPFIGEGESRITLSYDNTLDSARRLAHELGHAWHFKQMNDTPSLQFTDDLLEMTMAETSSIFFETVFIDHMLQQANKASVKKAILGPKIERSLNYLMSIRGAFLFENEFYHYRKESPLDVKQIEELSLRCQEKAYGNSLREYEPYVWTKYVQFYQATIPFYNYPYSFGFLFSIGLLEQAKEDKLFNQKFQGLLSETGRMPLEQLVKNHFQIDLSQPEFWQQAVQNVVRDIKQYNQLS